MKREVEEVGGGLGAERLKKRPCKTNNPIHSFCDIYNYRAVLMSSYH
jgi:hypothetical protein